MCVRFDEVMRCFYDYTFMTKINIFFFTFLSFLYRATQFHIKIKFILALEANSAASLYCTFFQVLPLYADWTSDAYCYPSRILHSIDLP